MRPPQLAAAAALFAMAVIQASRPAALMDPDLWWHLRTGEWIVAHAQVPRVDPFSTYGGGQPWVAYTWPFDVVLYGFYAAGALTGVSLLVCALWVALAGVLLHLARSLEVPPWRALAATGLCLVAIRGFAAPRPWLVSMVLLTVELEILFTAERSTEWQRLWRLPLLFVLWANLHIQFVYGLLVLGLVLAVSQAPVKRRMGIATTCAAATLLNPYGAGVYRVVLEYAGQGSLASVITELRHPDPRKWSTLLVVAAAGWAGAMLLRRGRAGLRFWPLLLAAVIFYFRAFRDAWFLATVATAIVLYCSARVSVKSTDAERHGPPVAILAGLLSGLLFAAARGHFRPGSVEAMLVSEYPAGAVEHVRSRHLAGPLLNTFDWGGYLIWHLPAIPVSMDGRTNIHPAQRVLAFDRLWHGDISAVTEFESMNLIIAPTDLPLTARLRGDPHFFVDYQDARAVVFVRAR